MRVVKMILAAAFLTSASSVLMISTADAASHAKKKAKPGMCGTMNYFDKKTKSCKSKG